MEHNSSKTLLILIVIALIAIGGGTVWYLMRPASTDLDITGTPQPITSRPIVAQSTNIIVYAPAKNARIGTPLIIEGEARVFENIVNYRLLDKNSNVLAEGYTTAQSPDVGQFGPFRGELNYMAEETGDGVLEVFWYSAKDGTPADVVTIPVTYTQTPEFIKG